MWQSFAKYHYLAHNLQAACRQFIAVYDGEVVAHTGVIQFPIRKGWKRIHRLVVLPDFQGVGIGVRFIDAVSDLVSKEGFSVNLTTTTPALVGALKRSQNWILSRKGVIKGDQFKSKLWAKQVSKANSSKRPTFSFNWKPSKILNGFQPEEGGSTPTCALQFKTP